MILNLFFIICFLILLTGMLWLYKVPEKVSLLRSFFLCFITELCMGAAITGLLSLAGLPVGLLSLGIGYLAIGCLIWVIILRGKKLQKLQLLPEDLYAFGVIALWFVMIFLVTFSPSINLAYLNSDPAVHLNLARNVMQTGRTSNMYFAEVFNAVVMKLFQPFISGTNLYKAFILSDSFANLINVYMFYCLGASMIRNRFSKLILPFLCFLYFIGWPYYSYAVGGFVYFGWGVTLTAYVVYLLILLYHSEERRNRLALMGLIAVGCYSVLVCYLLFSVILFGIVILALVLTARKNGLTLSKKKLLTAAAIVLLCLSAAAAFCFWGYFGGDFTYVLSALKEDGGIAKSFYQDFVFLLPGFFYMGYHYIKNRQPDLIFIASLVTIAYIFFTFFFCIAGILSSYYFYKPYYVLWFFIWLINIAFVDRLIEKDKIMLFSYGGAILLALLFTLSGADTRLEEAGIIYNDIARSNMYPSPFPLYDRAELFIKMDHYLPDKNAMIDMTNYIKENLPNTPVPLLSDEYWVMMWYGSFSGNTGTYVYSNDIIPEAVAQYKEEGIQYAALYKNTERFWNNNDLMGEYETVYDNGYFSIYDISR